MAAIRSLCLLLVLCLPVWAAPGGAAEPAGNGPPQVGSTVDASNQDMFAAYIGPSIRWAIDRGLLLHVVETRPIPLEPARLAATEKYSAQVRLSADRLGIENYVAGLPFPLVEVSDPDSAIKMMYNYENRIAADDLDVRNFECDTGSLDKTRPLLVERNFLLGHFRRLYYVGRLYHEPIHTWETIDGIRYREMLHPILEPFDLKGVGLTYNRYIDSSRHDDSWLYFPMLKRVRRLSSAQRSDALFGQDTDIDSYGGYAGNIAWMEWRLLGMKKLLGAMHTRHFPGRWSHGAADFMFDDDWELRDVYVIEGRSRLPGYAYSKRIIYLDRESFVVPYTELYDQQGQLWKAWVNQWKIAREVFPGAKRAVYDHEQQFLPAITMYDMQLEHATRCTIPSSRFPGEEAWYLNFGEAEGTTEDVFLLKSMIASGR